ncbi:hypothetical protein COLO4_35897 [Corchorus olitorius]|uniref:Uncharacterized protein n=1 Tax=Corchorus olitorius TaxID=93759 RepID=A0A1R3GC35_9ROSI|nr:hypothetical protein COLO4_35897 [Corchorus olitorius]
MGENVITSNNDNIHLHDDEEHAAEEAEEALSLCDLALDLDSNDLEKMPARSRRSSSSSDAAAGEFFEFLSDLSSDMCPADDIIFCGKLIPLKQRPLSFQTQKVTYPFGHEKTRKTHVLRKRSESLSELRSASITRSDSTKNTNVLRNSRSLDYQKLHRFEMERNPSVRSVGKSDQVSPKKAVKPRWYIFMFGMVKFPPEMELKDIKSRQSRRNQSAMFPLAEDHGGKKFAGNRSSGKGASWNLLKALSCRDHTSVAVTASFWMPPEPSQA